MNNLTKISACRICGNRNLVEVIDLGEQYLTGVFPRSVMKDTLTRGPLRLVKCHGENNCGLLQLDHSYDLEEMYGDNYGYRSGLNANMVKHLRSKIDAIVERSNLKSGDLVVDIGSNDGTSLGFYPDTLQRVGVDPTSGKFKKYYKPDVTQITDFFSAELIRKKFPNRKAQVVTSFSMLYDLEHPQDFVNDIASILDPENGIWVSEQSYMPLMLERIAFDTICHEHIEYYSLKQLIWMANQAGLEIIDAELNDVNGGSVSVVMALRGSKYTPSQKNILKLLNHEEQLELDTLVPYKKFRNNIEVAGKELADFVKSARSKGKRVCGLGASTKGNVLLQYCGFTRNDIEMIAEVNPDKFGSMTPGTWIPISSEADVLASKPDYLMVLPWHFREFFVDNPAFKGYTLVFPLPELEVVEL